MEPVVRVRTLDVLGRIGGSNGSVPTTESAHCGVCSTFAGRLGVRADPEFCRRVRCHLDGSWLSVQGTGQEKSNYVWVFRQYALIWIGEEGQEWD